MTRLLLLIIANFALPFLLWSAKIYFLRWMAKRHAKKQGRPIIDVTPEQSKVPIVRLLIYGAFLLLISLAGWRLISTESDHSWNTGNEAKSANF